MKLLGGRKGRGEVLRWQHDAATGLLKVVGHLHGSLTITNWS